MSCDRVLSFRLMLAPSPECQWRPRFARHSPEANIVVIDGIYAADENGQPEFHELPPPEDADVVRVAALVAERVESLLKRRGLGPGDDPDTAEALGRDEPGLAAIYSASIRGRIASGASAGNRVISVG